MRPLRWTLAALVLAGPLALMATPLSAHPTAGTKVREPKYGFTFDLPARWNTVPLDGSDITALLNQATHDDPSLTNALSSEVKAATSEGIKVFAVGPLVGTFVPNVNVVVESSSGAPTGSACTAAASAQAKAASWRWT